MRRLRQAPGPHVGALAAARTSPAGREGRL